METQYDRLPDTLEGVQIIDPLDWELVFHAEEKFKTTPVVTFTHKSIQNSTKITKSKMNHLIKTGAVSPFQQESGRGGRSKFSYQNKLEFLFCREMRRLSIDISVIKDNLRWLNEKKWRFPFTPTFLTAAPQNDEDEINTRAVREKIEKGILPDSIDRVHTIWEFMEIYPYYLANFFYMQSISDYGNKSQRTYMYVFSNLDIVSQLMNNPNAVVINFRYLKIEADKA